MGVIVKIDTVIASETSRLRTDEYNEAMLTSITIRRRRAPFFCLIVIVDRSERTRKSIVLLTFTVGGRPSQCFSCIGVRGFFSSPLIIFGKRLELTRNP